MKISFVKTDYLIIKYIFIIGIICSIFSVPAIVEVVSWWTKLPLLILICISITIFSVFLAVMEQQK